MLDWKSFFSDCVEFETIRLLLFQLLNFYLISDDGFCFCGRIFIWVLRNLDCSYLGCVEFDILFEFYGCWFWVLFVRSCEPELYKQGQGFVIHTVGLMENSFIGCEWPDCWHVDPTSV